MTISTIAIGQKSKEKDTTRLISFVDKIIIKTNVDTRTDTYKLRQDGEQNSLIVQANNTYRLFLSLDYEFLGFSYGFSPKFFTSNSDQELKGESSFSDYRFRFFLGNWVQSVQYSKVKGYYIENTQDFVPNWAQGMDPYLQMPDLTNVVWGMSTAYVFNPRFSLRNVTYQTEWQKESAGSLVPTLFYDYNKFSFNLENSRSIESNFNLRLALNYYYTFVMNQNWFVTPNFSPSLGVRFSKNTDHVLNIETIENNTYITRFLEGGIQLGYSSNKVIFGGSFNFNANWYGSEKKERVENDKIYGLVYLGYRFDAPSFVKKTMDTINKEIGI